MKYEWMIGLVLLTIGMILTIVVEARTFVEETVPRLRELSGPWYRKLGWAIKWCTVGYSTGDGEEPTP